jgi:H+/Cl- antiporter ClcA
VKQFIIIYFILVAILAGAFGVKYAIDIASRKKILEKYWPLIATLVIIGLQLMAMALYFRTPEAARR